MKSSAKSITRQHSRRAFVRSLSRKNIEDDITDSTTRCDDSWRSLSVRSLTSETPSRLSVDGTSANSGGSSAPLRKLYRSASNRCSKLVWTTMRQKEGFGSRIENDQRNVAPVSMTIEEGSFENTVALDVTDAETDKEKALTSLVISSPTAFSLFQSQSKRSAAGGMHCLSVSCHSVPSSRGARRHTSELAKPTRPVLQHKTMSCRELNVNNASPPLTRNRISDKQFPSQSQVFGMLTAPCGDVPQKHSSRKSHYREIPITHSPPDTRQQSKQRTIVDRPVPQHSVSGARTSSILHSGYFSPRQRPRRHVTTRHPGPPVRTSRSFNSSVHKSSSLKPLAEADFSQETLKQLLKEYDMLMIDANDETLTGW